MGKTFIEILFKKTKMAMATIKMTKTKIIVNRGEMIISSVMGEIWMEEMFEAALKAKDTIVEGKKPIHKQIPPSTAMGAHRIQEFSFTCVVSIERLFPKNI